MESFEKNRLKNKFESAKVITPNGDIFELIGDARNVDPTELGIDLTGAYITHNHPEGLHNFAFFTANNLKLLRAIDEKKIHTWINNGSIWYRFCIVELAKLDTEKVTEYLQRTKAVDLNIKYRRFKHGY